MTDVLETNAFVERAEIEGRWFAVVGARSRKLSPSDP